jgi:hypothetical protein
MTQSLLTQGHVGLQEIARAMQSIGYREDLHLLQRNYEYTNVTVRHQEVHTIDLAGFAQSPPTYRNVCIGVVVSNGAAGAELVATHRTLGAPLMFEINGTVINRWKVTASGEPEFKESIPFGDILNAFDRRKNEWEPESILRAKAIGDIKGPVQLDFYDEDYMPFLEGSNFSKLEDLLRDILSEIDRVYKDLGQRPPRFQNLFRLVFRFVAAKVFRDRKHPGDWESNDALTAIRAIEAYYGDALPPSQPFKRVVLDRIWRIFLTTFKFPNLSEDDLALFFEKSFITPETRRTLGIHSTPPRVVDYIVGKLPFEDLAEDERYVLEPFAGHGRFLIASMRRMRDLLSTPMSDAERHNYFVRRLVGIELDALSVEVCKLSLMLADYPNRNSWRIYQQNVFDTDTLDKELKRSRVVLCNPPFEAIPPGDRARYSNPNLLIQKPAELLRRVLSSPPEMLGLVLPIIFQTGGAYRGFHRRLSEVYENVELVNLPEVFNYSEALTTLVVAHGKRRHLAPVAVTCRKVKEGAEKDNFLKYGIEPAATKTIFGVSDYLNPRFSLWVMPLSRVWDYLRYYPKLEDETEIHRGVKCKSVERGISDTERPGFYKGFPLAEGHLTQFQISGTFKYLSRRKQDQDDGAYKWDWDSPKVACNAARLRRYDWRLGAVADTEGLTFSQRFFGIWPRGKATIHALAALLNSPVANAYVFAKEEDRDNHVWVLNSIPIPAVQYLVAGSTIDSLSRELHRILTQRRVDEDKARRTLLRLDAEILRAYDLPPQLEYEVLSTFQDKKRPLPFEFTGYYPKGFEAYYPLHEIISEEFELARADRLMDRLPMIEDKELGEYLDYLYDEGADYLEESVDEQRLPH